MKRMFSRHLLVVGSIMPLLSCDAEDLFTGPLTSEACSQVGVRHTADESPGTWRRGMSPHILTDSVRIEGKLVIEPGTVICGMPGSALFASDLEAIGSESLPIVFTSVGAEGWQGLRGAGAVRHARIENTDWAVWSQTGYELENVHILRSRGPAVAQAARLRNVVIDSACTVVTPNGCGAVYAIGLGGIVLDDVTIRWSGDSGILTGFRSCGVTIDGGSIEGSAGPGLHIGTQHILSCGLQVIAPMRITGGASYPAQIHALAATELLRHPEALGAMKGNARDTLYVIGHHHFGIPAGNGEITIPADLPLRFQLSCGAFSASYMEIGSITLEPAASLTLSGCTYVGHVRAMGTAAERITINGSTFGGRLMLSGGHPDTASFSHVNFRHNLHVVAEDAPAIFTDVSTDSSSLVLTASGSRVNGLRAWRSGRAQPWIASADSLPAITLGNGTAMHRAHIEGSTRDGVLIVDGSNVVIEECTITASGRNGMHVLSGAPTIRSCNFVGNGTAGIHNVGPDVVDARWNWWGGATGPSGPSADRVVGNVMIDPFLDASVQFTCGTGCTSPALTVGGAVLHDVGAPPRAVH